MKKLTLAVITSLVAVLGYQPTGEAAGPKIRRVRTTRPAIGSDLRCQLEAFTDAAGTKPLVNNGSEVNLGDVWVRATVRNFGLAEAKSISNSLSILRSGSSVHSSSPELTIPGGFSMTFPMVKVAVGNSGSMQATLKVDIEGEMAESNELNNTCTFKTTSHKLH